MARFKLMNVLLSEMPQFLGAPLLLHRSTGAVAAGDEPGSWRLATGTHDFTTFFNALSVQKWQLYTVADNFHLHLELRGGASSIVLTRADTFSWSSEEIAGTRVEVAASSEWQEVEVDLPAAPRDVLESFAIEAPAAGVELRNGYFYTEVDEGQVREVELALCTTTFKKEAYIERNIGLVRSEILASDEPIARHFQMHVVDNGRTLDAEALSGGAVSIHPNDNVGGAGGFARGMIEAMEQTPRATHVLLMDDDVLVSPESIIRTFNLLSLLNDDYVEAFVSGAMMNLDEPNIRWEDMGFISADGSFRQIKPALAMDYFHNVVDNECFDIPSYLPKCNDQDQTYAAWWYCAIPMSQIDRNGLPLPIFVRGDDVEFSRRCKPRFMTMNGICIWHMPFHTRYNAAQEYYQMTRNCLIDQFASDFAPLTDFLERFDRLFYLAVGKFNYTDASLLLDGLEDFLKGPEWVMDPTNSGAFLEANKRAEKLRPLDELADELAELGVDVADITTWKTYRDLPFTTLDRREYKLTVNGNRFTQQYVQRGKVAVVDYVYWAEMFGKIQHAEYIVALDFPQRRGVIRHVDRDRFRELWDRYKRDLKEYELRAGELRAAYSAARTEMTSIDFWKHYLGI